MVKWTWKLLLNWGFTENTLAIQVEHHECDHWCNWEELRCFCAITGATCLTIRWPDWTEKHHQCSHSEEHPFYSRALKSYPRGCEVFCCLERRLSKNFPECDIERGALPLAFSSRSRALNSNASAAGSGKDILIVVLLVTSASVNKMYLFKEGEKKGIGKSVKVSARTK